MSGQVPGQFPSIEITSPEAGSDETSILFICTANRCRSPFAEAIARRRVGAGPYLIASAGLMEGGYPVPKNGLQVASELGLALTTHRSKQVQLDALAGWDVILTMTREHVRELIAADPALWPRVFTVKQFRRWIEANPPSRRMKLGAWIDLAAAERSRLEMIGMDPNDDVRDPLNSAPPVWREVAGVLDDEIGAIVDVLSGGRRAS